MENFEFKNLNKHHIALEMDKILKKLSEFTNSTKAKSICLALSLIQNKNTIIYELTLVDEAKKIIDDTQSSIPIKEICDIEVFFNNNRLNAKEIIEITNNLKDCRICKNYILKNEKSNLKAIVQNLYVNKEIEDEIFNTFDKDLKVRDEASNTLKSLRNSYKDNKDNLKNAINSLLQNPAFVEHLQDTVVSTRDDRPVFQVKASSKNKIEGIVHDVSATNLTYFIEPSSLIPLSNKLKQIEIEIQAEIDRILYKLTQILKEIKDELVKNEEILTKLDIIFAKAKYSIFLKGVSAELTDEKIIDIQKMRHPLLIGLKEEIVANDLILGKSYNCLLITGSNTGGKTVALKTAGLMVLMTMFALHIPCLGAKIYPYSNIFCDISTEQNLEQGISTYSAHIKNISEIIEKANENSLILLDEFGSGTDPNEGSSICQSILEFFKEKNIQSIITTHLGELKSLKYKNDYFENATVLFDIETLKPKYNLIIGMSGTSNAIDISKNLGLNDEIIKRAREIFLKNNSNTTGIFLEIEKTNQELLKKVQQADIELENAKEANISYNEKLKEIKQNKKKSLENFKKKFQNNLDDARDEIKKIVEEIRKEKSLKVAIRSYEKLNKLESKIREDFTNEDNNLAEKYKELDKNSLKIGQNVLVKNLEQVVILDSLPDKKGFVQIRIGNITSKIHISKLAKTDKKINPKLKKVQVTFDTADNLISRLDLRGMRAMDAIEYLDENLDKASLKGLNQITIIHGFGTGALKKAVNDYLKTSPYVSKFRYGDENEGRDGVTIVDLI